MAWVSAGIGVKTYYSTWTTDGNGDEDLGSINLSGEVVQVVAQRDDEVSIYDRVPYLYFTDEDGIVIDIACAGRLVDPPYLYGEYTVTMIGPASETGKVKLYVR